MTNKSIQKKVYNEYCKNGQLAAMDLATIFNAKFEDCPACECNMPAINHECLICGTTTNPTIEPLKKGDNITIIGRRWFDKSAGNTYFSAVALINGNEVANIPFKYGYGNQYEHEMFKELVKLGYCPDNDKQEVLWHYCDRKGITKYVTHSDVSRKKDL